MRDEDRRSRPPVPGWLGALGEPVYGAAIALRNARFDRGWGVRRFPFPILSIGNLSVGGTGKTPMVAMVVRKLLTLGRRPAIVMRGYKSAPGGFSDEQAEYRAMFGESVPVIADPNRRRAIATVVRKKAADCIVLDDGFQHRRVGRDLDIVLLDASRDVFSDCLLPKGWLREPVGSLARAGVVVMTHAGALDEAGRERVWRRVRTVAPDAVQVEACHAWADLRVFERGVERAEPVTWLKDRAVVVAPGIGNPSTFSEQVRATGANVVREEFWPDHHYWIEPDAQGLIDNAADFGWTCIVTTMKDWVKIAPLVPRSPIPWCVPVLEMRLVTGSDRFDEAVNGAIGFGPCH